MTLRRKALSDKVMVLGVDGLDPRYSRKMIREGKMPNLKKYIEMGAAREDLMLLGGHPTVTPPMWTTLGTGCYANVHGVTGYFRQGSDIDKIVGSFDSRDSKAEPVWNCLAEAGIKTAVVHWPGNSWPPTSDSENLIVIDGSSPGPLGAASAGISDEFLVVADVKMEHTTFLVSDTADLDKACIVKPEDCIANVAFSSAEWMRDTREKTNLIMHFGEGNNAVVKPDNLSLAVSKVTEPTKWGFEVPEGAKEFTLLLSSGTINRYGLILKNEQGEYDHVALYRNKKTDEPFAILSKGVMIGQIHDKAAMSDGIPKDANYDMKLLDISADGTHVEIYVSNGINMHAEHVFQPSSLHDELVAAVGNIPPGSYFGNHDARMITDCMRDVWDIAVDWQSAALHYLIDKKGVKAIFSHCHNVDMQEHRFIRFMSEGDKRYIEEYGAKNVEQYNKFLEDVYVQTDRYLGSFMHYLDDGWTIIITSDHAQVCPAHRPHVICDPQGVTTGVMGKLGYTVMKKDENGNDLPEIDFTKTTAVANRECKIYINLKGRNPHGIVDPKDKYELEEQIMTDLYGYRDEKTGKRIIALALRNKDAILLGYGGPDCGDICYWMAEGYNIDHADGLSTTYGDCETSLSPIFIAAGQGIKQGYTTERWIRQIDVVPTICTLMNVRMPAQCEGAPVYQILSEEF